MCITASVGRDCRNGRGDVKTIQILLNMNIDKLGMDELDEDGDYGTFTQTGIEIFQRSVVGTANPDGKVDPGGKTLLTMAKGIPAAFCSGILQGIYVNASDELVHRYCDPLGTKMLAYGIDTPLRMAHFLAQLGHESGELRYCEEIASGDAYEGRRDLGNTKPGDGRRFKGRGLIQLTGRANYTAYSNARGIDYTTDEGAKLVGSDPETAVDVACWYWTTRKLNQWADRDDVARITRLINGGLNGFDDRKMKLLRSKFFIPMV